MKLRVEPEEEAPPIRSLLFVPGNREDRIRKALASEADGIVIDLESATPAGELEAARAICRGIIEERARSTEAGRPVILVRVARAGSPDQALDLEAVVRTGLTGILLPQVALPRDVIATDEALARHEATSGVRVGRTRIMPLVESASAVRWAFEIASSSPRVAYMGGATSRGGDLARSIGFRFTPGGRETLYLRSKVLIDVRAAGIVHPISGIWGRLDDPEGLRAFATESRDLGYDGLMTIHPSQLRIVNEVFSPSAEEIDEWQRILEAMAQAAREGRGAIRLDGRLVDEAHVVTARERLERARRLGLA